MRAILSFEPPRGFGAAYRRAMREPLKAHALSDLLALIGYDAAPEVIERWSAIQRAQAQVYATNVHLRAGDNAIQRHPRPDWMPEPWQGDPPCLDHIREDLRGAFEGPGGTPIP